MVPNCRGSGNILAGYKVRRALHPGHRLYFMRVEYLWALYLVIDTALEIIVGALSACLFHM